MKLNADQAEEQNEGPFCLLWESKGAPLQCRPQKRIKKQGFSKGFLGVPVAPVGPLDSHDVGSDFQFDGWGVES